MNFDRLMADIKAHRRVCGDCRRAFGGQFSVCIAGTMLQAELTALFRVAAEDGRKTRQILARPRGNT